MGTSGDKDVDTETEHRYIILLKKLIAKQNHLGALTTTESDPIIITNARKLYQAAHIAMHPRSYNEVNDSQIRTPYVRSDTI